MLMIVMCMLLTIVANKRVSVFTKDGQFVTSCSEGYITNPDGVFVDSDGSI